MAFAIATTPEVPKWKTDYSPADRQENYKAIIDYINQYLNGFSAEKCPD